VNFLTTVGDGTVNPQDLQVNPTPIDQTTNEEIVHLENDTDIVMAPPEGNTDNAGPDNQTATAGGNTERPRPRKVRDGEAGTKRYRRDSGESDDAATPSGSDGSDINRNGKRPAQTDVTAEDPPAKRPPPKHAGKTPKKTPVITAATGKKTGGKGNILIAEPGDIVADFAKSLCLDTDLPDAPEYNTAADACLDIQVRGEVSIDRDICYR
jgi:hypothetical protein